MKWGLPAEAAVEAVVAVDSIEVVVAAEEAEEDMDNLNGVTLPMEALVETTMEVVANLLIMWPFHQINVDLSSEKVFLFSYAFTFYIDFQYVYTPFIWWIWSKYLGGETIKSINQQTGAHCEVDRNAPPDARDKNFVIRGTPEQVERAKQMILEKIGMPGPGGGGGYGGPNSYGSGGQPTSWGGQYQQGGYQPEPSTY